MMERLTAAVFYFIDIYSELLYTKTFIVIAQLEWFLRNEKVNL